jgi:hypothetical protein
MIRCECGRKAVSRPRRGKKRSRKARAGKPYAIAGHNLCFQCWERFNDQQRAASMVAIQHPEPRINWEGPLLAVRDGRSKRTYRVEPIDAGDVLQFRLLKQKRLPSGSIYFDYDRTVTVRHDGTPCGCSCIGHSFHQTGRQRACVHLLAVPLLLERWRSNMAGSKNGVVTERPAAPEIVNETPQTVLPTDWLDQAVQKVESKIATQRPRGILISKVEELLAFADLVWRSGLAGKHKNAASVAIGVQYGMELGMTPMHAVNSVIVIHGRPGLESATALGIVLASGQMDGDAEEFFELDGKPFSGPITPASPDGLAAVCRVKRKGGQWKETRFSVADAKTAKLWPAKEDAGWTKYPGRMLRARALGFRLNDSFPDVLKNLRTAEELMDYPPLDGALPIANNVQAPAPVINPQPAANTPTNAPPPAAVTPPVAAIANAAPAFDRTAAVKEVESFFFPKFPREKVAVKLKQLYNKDCVTDLTDADLQDMLRNISNAKRAA